MHFTLRQLQVFLAVARHENVSRAAQELVLSQSAASAALADLERQFDLRLFDRAGKRLHLNDLGRATLPRVVELLDRAQELEDLLRGQSVLGLLGLGASLTIGNYLATLLVSDYLQRHPGSQVKLKVANTAAIIRQVADFELDLGLVEGPCHHPNLEVLPWVKDRLEVFAAPDHPLATQSELKPEDLAEADWILREHGSGTREVFDRATEGVLARIRIRFELEHTEAIKRAVESRLGIGCVSRLALREAYRRGSLAPLNCPFLNLERRFLILVHKDKYRTAACRGFIELCFQHGSDGFATLQRDIP